MGARSARAYFSIGEVLAQLQGEYDVSVSKILFLGSGGLIEPARSPSGYRRFGPADVERLRYILTTQRDQYLPLRVIKDRLARGGQPAAAAAARASPRSQAPARQVGPAPASATPAAAHPQRPHAMLRR